MLSTFFLMAVAAGLAISLKAKTASFGLLTCMVGSWFFGLVCFILYLSGHNYYYNVVSNIFGFNRSVWNWFAMLPNNKDIAIFGFILSVCAFLYCFACYCISFAFSFKRSPRLWLFLSIMPLLEFIFYNPVTWHLFEKICSSETVRNFFVVIEHFGTPFFRVINIIYIVGSLMILLYSYWARPNIQFFKKNTLYNFFTMLLIAGMYLILFYWMPLLLIKPTLIRYYFAYRIPSIIHNAYFINIFSIFSPLCFLLIGFFAYRHHAAVVRDFNIKVNMDKTIDTAALGMRIFTHSMKNQLLAIHSETEYLTELLTQHTEAQYSLTLIRQACQNAFDSINAGNEVLRTRQLHLNRISILLPLQDALLRIRGSAPEALIQTNFPSEVIFAFLDRELVTEVFLNILNNALEASSKPADLLISVRAHNDWACITFEDHGCGMDEDELSRIFDPFYSTKSSVRNWGIGLTYCHRIITAHDGFISVKSRKGEGTCFELSFPQA